MKKINAYFTDPQLAALDTFATEAGISFAEALRRALDVWRAHREGHPMATMPTSPPVITNNVYVVVVEDGDRTTLTFRNAGVAHNEFDGSIEIYRLKKDGSPGRTLAQFSKWDMSSWYQDGTDADEDEDA